MLGSNNYIEFELKPSGLSVSFLSHWECRNLGLLKIMTGVFDRLLAHGNPKRDYTVRVNTADGPTRSQRSKGDDYYMEFDTSSFGRSDSLFPDYIFGNWWHIGLLDFDTFTREIVLCSSRDRIRDNRLFWMGNLQGIWQRLRYKSMAEEFPELMVAETMTWIMGGRKPTKFVPMKDYSEYGNLIDLTGRGCSGRLKLLPFCNRPLFVAKRRCLSWSDILMLDLDLHIPVEKDLSDLVEKCRWAVENEDLCSRNSEELLSWCETNFTFKSAVERAFGLVQDQVKALGD